MENRMEDLANGIYESIVAANFRDLDPLDEQLIYEVACEQAINDYVMGYWKKSPITQGQVLTAKSSPALLALKILEYFTLHGLPSCAHHVGSPSPNQNGESFLKSYEVSF